MAISSSRSCLGREAVAGNLTAVARTAADVLLLPLLTAAGRWLWRGLSELQIGPEQPGLAVNFPQGDLIPWTIGQQYQVTGVNRQVSVQML